MLNDSCITVGLHNILHAIVKRISSVKTVLWLAVNLHHLFSDGAAFNAFLMIKFLSLFLNKLVISRYTMFYNNVTLYLKVLFWLKTCKQKSIEKTKAFKIKQSKRKNQADRANYSTQRTYTQVSLYLLCVYIVSRIHSERNNNMLGWKFVTQSGNNKNMLINIMCANSFLELGVKPLSLEETLNMSEDNSTIR